MSPAEGISAILEGDNLIGGATGWSSAVAKLSGSGAQVAVIDSGGRGGEVKVAIDYPSVQILVRGKATAGGYTEGWEKARAIYAHLQAIEDQTEYPELVSCVAIGYINPLAMDENNHPIFSLNWGLIIEPSQIGNRDY